MNKQNRFYTQVKHEDTLKGLVNAVPRGLHIDSDWHFNQALRERMICIRVYYGVPRAIIAKVTGTSYRQYLRYETEKGIIPVHVASSLAYFYNLSLDFVCGLSDTPKKLYEGEPTCVNGYTLTDYWGKITETDINIYSLPLDFCGILPAFGRYPKQDLED